MRLKKTLLCGFSAIALATASAFADDSAFNYSELSGLERYDAIQPSEYEPLAYSEPMESDVIWIFPVETIVLVPSLDSETTTSN